MYIKFLIYFRNLSKFLSHIQNLSKFLSYLGSLSKHLTHWLRLNEYVTHFRVFEQISITFSNFVKMITKIAKLEQVSIVLAFLNKLIPLE